MNLIDYNQAMEALDKERQMLLNREQYGAEHVLVHHAINVIAELPIIRQPEIIRCKDCKHYNFKQKWCDYLSEMYDQGEEWFCAEGERKDG